MPIGKLINLDGHSFKPETQPSSQRELNSTPSYEITEIVDKNEIDDIKSEKIVSGVYEGEFESILRRERSRVQPFEAVEDIYNDASLSMPRSESVIDVEIRLAKEKERDLRKSKGVNEEEEKNEKKSLIYYILDSQEKNEINLVEKGEKTQKDLTMKRMSENRLKYEFLENKKREQDLLDEGKIQSISQVIDINMLAKGAYISQYSKEELNGVSLDDLKARYKENSSKSNEASMTNDGDLKDIKIKVTKDHVLKLEEIIKQNVVRQESFEHEIKSVNNLNSLTNSVRKTENKVESPDHAVEKYSKYMNTSIQEELVENISNIKINEKKNINSVNEKIFVNKIENQSNGHFTKNSSANQQINSSANKPNNVKIYNTEYKVIYDKEETNSSPTTYRSMTNSATDIDIKPLNKKKVSRRSLAPGDFKRFSSHGDTEKKIAREIEQSKQREIELQKGRGSSLLTEAREK